MRRRLRVTCLVSILAGVIVAGMRTSEIFIENGRFHGQQIAADLKQKLRDEITTSYKYLGAQD